MELGKVDTSTTVDSTQSRSIASMVGNRFVAYFRGVNNDEGDELVPPSGPIVMVAGAGSANGGIGGGSVGGTHSLGANPGAAGPKFPGLEGSGGGFPQFEADGSCSAIPEPSTR